MLGCVNSPRTQNKLSRNLSFVYFDMSAEFIVTFNRSVSQSVSHLVEELHHELERGVRGAAAQRWKFALPPTRRVLPASDGDFLQRKCPFCVSPVRSTLPV